MSTLKHYFSINDILRFVVIDNTGYFNRMFDTLNIHYENFKLEDEPNNYDLIIELGKFNPKLENNYISNGGKLYLRENYIFVSEEKYKGAKWRFELQGLNDRITTAKIDCNALGRLFITGNVIDFLIHLKLMEKGYPIIHASAVSKNNSAFAFSSRGGGGKTTIALELVSKGYSFLGDNYVVIHNGDILSFPTSLSIFTYNLAPIIVKNMRFKKRVAVGFRSLIYKLSMGYAKFFTKINPKRICNNIQRSAKLRTTFILMPRMDISSDLISIKEIDLDEFIKMILYNQMLEFPFFGKYIKEYSYFFPQKNFSQHWKRYEDTLRKNFNNDSLFYKIVVPEKYDKNVFEGIRNWLI